MPQDPTKTSVPMICPRFPTSLEASTADIAEDIASFETRVKPGKRFRTEELARLLSHVFVFTPTVQLTISFDSKQHFKLIWSSAVRFLSYTCKRSHFRLIAGQYVDSNVNSGQRLMKADSAR